MTTRHCITCAQTTADTWGGECAYCHGRQLARNDAKLSDLNAFAAEHVPSLRLGFTDQLAGKPYATMSTLNAKSCEDCGVAISHRMDRCWYCFGYSQGRLDAAKPQHAFIKYEGYILGHGHGASGLTNTRVEGLKLRGKAQPVVPPVYEPFPRPSPEHIALSKAADEMVRFVAGLNMQDQPITIQRQLLVHIRAVGEALGGKKAAS